jgi:cell migration-inducing and hyaluronan-binding protein
VRFAANASASTRSSPLICSISGVLRVLLHGLLFNLALSTTTRAAEGDAGATATTCDHSLLPQSASPGMAPDLLVTGECHVTPDKVYYYRSVNILNNGRLIFDELGQIVKATVTDFWATSLIIENGGALIAGDSREPYGNYGGVLTIHLYGTDQSIGNPSANPGLGARCKSPETETSGPCGIPRDVWVDNGKTKFGADGTRRVFRVQGPVRAYGGSLELWGAKGFCNSLGCNDPRKTHPSWTRLEGSVSTGGGSLVVAGPSIYNPENLGVQAGDRIVVTTTDYLPGHSEVFTVEAAVTGLDRSGQRWIETIQVDHGAKWPHNGERYSLADRLTAARTRLNLDPSLVKDGVETRAAVALLNRSITLRSARGPTPLCPPRAPTTPGGELAPLLRRKVSPL